LSDPQFRFRVAIVDDDENDKLSIRNNLARLPGIEFVNTYASGEEALNGIPGSGVDMVLMDIRMAGMDGIECTRKLKAVMPCLKIIMTTGLLESRHVKQSRKAGADGYLTKPVSPVHFLAWIYFLSGTWPRVCNESPIAEASDSSAGNFPNYTPLNSREKAVADLVSKGYRDKEIGDQLRLSVCVVGNLIKSIRRKLDASNRAQVASRFHSDADRFRQL
jgi:DNA-binding NarL/FixJ family response regulator